MSTGHEEVDTRFFHILNALRKGADYIISAVDADVIVIMVRILFKLQTYNPNIQLW